MSKNLLVACMLAGLALGPGSAYADPTQIHKASCSNAALMLHWRDASKADCIHLVLDGNGVSKLLLLGGEGEKDVELLEFNHSDERIGLLRLDDYHNTAFVGPRHGEAVHVVFPEKSSAVIFWNVKTELPTVFWESD